MRGNSFSNGGSYTNGPCAPYSWLSGYQMPRPVDCWQFMEPDGRERC